jgi:hypothetical protein
MKTWIGFASSPVTLQKRGVCDLALSSTMRLAVTRVNSWPDPVQRRPARVRRELERFRMYGVSKRASLGKPVLESSRARKAARLGRRRRDLGPP